MKIYDYFEKLKKDDKIVQSFLIGNIYYENYKDELQCIFNDFFFYDKKKIEDNPDIYVLKQDNSIITKGMVKELLNNLSTTSQFSSVKIYVIDESDKLSDTVCNALLKTLEEPEKNIYAFLLTNNIDAVLPTIASRCQKIFVSSGQESNNVSTEYTDIANKIISDIEKDGVKTIAIDNEIYSIIKDRTEFINILSSILCIYRMCLYDILNERKNEKYNFIIKNNSIESLSKKILTTDKTINMLSNYLNKNLSIDRFIIEMWRCNI